MSTFIVGLFCIALNIPLGRLRTKYKKFSFPWWLAIHASIPFIIPLRIYLGTSLYFIPLFIALAVLGQYIGQKSVVRKSV